MENNKILFSIGKALYDNEKYLEALRYLELAANEGNTDAMVLCGEIRFEKGEKGMINHKEAANFFKRAADLGNIRGMFKFGRMLRFGFGIKINKYEAWKFYKKAEEETNKNIKYLEKNGEEITTPNLEYTNPNTGEKYNLPKCNIILNPYNYNEQIYDFAKNNMENLAFTGSRDELICNFFNIFLGKCEISDRENIGLILAIIKSEISLIQKFIELIYDNGREDIIDLLIENLDINNICNIFLFACNNDKIDLIEKIFSFYISSEEDNENKLLLLDTGLKITYDENHINSTKKIIQLEVLKFFGEFLDEENREKLFENTLEINDISNITTKTKEPILYKILSSDFVNVSPIFIETIIKIGMNFGENGFNCNRNELGNINKNIQSLSEKFGLNQENKLSKQITDILSRKKMFLFSSATITINEEDLKELNKNLAEFSRILSMSIENKKESEKSSVLGNFEDDLDKEGELEKTKREIK